MSKNRRGNQFVRCEYCRGEGWVKVQSGRRRSKSARSKGHTFESSVAAIASNGWAPGSNGFRPRPTEPEFDPDLSGALSPGETRSSTVYQKWDLGDLLKAAGLALLSGTMFGASSLIICIPIRAKWYWPVGSFVVPMLTVWIIKAVDLVGGDSTVVRKSSVSRPPEAAPIIQEAPSAEIVINAGNKQTRAKLRAPSSNHAGLHQYADALIRGTAAASYAGGKGDDGILGAKAFGYTPAEFDGRSDAWRPTAIAGGIIEKDPHKSKGYKLTELGRRGLAQVAKHQLGGVFV